MSASSKRRRRTIQRRNAKAWAAPTATPVDDPTPPAEENTAPEQQVSTEKPKRMACAPCGIETFASNREAVEHSRSIEHRINVAGTDYEDLPPATRTSTNLQQPIAPPRRGVKVQEARPWEIENSDHSLNLGSYAFIATMRAVQFAYQMVQDHSAEVGMPSTVGDVQKLADYMLRAADQVQKAAREDGRGDRMDASYNRARGAVNVALRACPVPWDEPQREWDVWLTQLVEQATIVMSVGVDLHKRYVRPWEFE